MASVVYWTPFWVEHFWISETIWNHNITFFSYLIIVKVSQMSWNFSLIFLQNNVHSNWKSGYATNTWKISEIQWLLLSCMLKDIPIGNIRIFGSGKVRFFRNRVRLTRQYRTKNFTLLCNDIKLPPLMTTIKDNFPILLWIYFYQVICNISNITNYLIKITKTS